MSNRGKTFKTRTGNTMILERPMVTRHYKMTWDLDRCVGCQMGPTACPKDALTHLEGEIVDGRMVTPPSVDVDPDACVMCGICVEICPVHAIEMRVNENIENPVLAYDAFPEVRGNIKFDKLEFDFSLKDFVINNCPTSVISYDQENDTMAIKYEDCIRCRQCEVASKGAFKVSQAWQGSVELHRENVLKDVLPVQMSAQPAPYISTIQESWYWQITIASSVVRVCMPVLYSRNLKRKNSPLNLRD